MTRPTVSYVVALALPAAAYAQEWNRAGLPDSAIDAPRTPAAAAPRRDISGIWDAGGVGIAGPGPERPPWTDGAKEKATFKPGKTNTAR